MNTKKAIVSVTNDLNSDQRVHKVCLFLQKHGYEVLLVGRIKHDSIPLEKRSYATKRFWLPAEKGMWFYIFYQIRLFFFLLFNNADLFVSNDLDTLLPNYWISQLKNIRLVYDSHEYFCGVPELINRPGVQSVWHRVEKYIFPKLKTVYTVNDSIAEMYHQEYNVDVKVVRNVPVRIEEVPRETRKDLGLPENIPIILYQGAGINIERGVEELVESMKYLENVLLLIIGSGDVIEKVKEIAQQNEIKSKVKFIGKLPFAELRKYAHIATLGVTIDKDLSPNYRLSLPNKLFDYLHAGLPILSSILPEVMKIMNDYKVGTYIENHHPEHIAGRIKFMLSDPEQLSTWKTNALEAAKTFNWQNEEKMLEKIYNI